MTRGETRTRPLARATRVVTSFSETSTMRAAPASSMCVSLFCVLNSLRLAVGAPIGPGRRGASGRHGGR